MARNCNLLYRRVALGREVDGTVALESSCVHRRFIPGGLQIRDATEFNAALRTHRAAAPGDCASPPPCHPRPHSCLQSRAIALRILLMVSRVAWPAAASDAFNSGFSGAQGITAAVNEWPARNSFASAAVARLNRPP